MKQKIRGGFLELKDILKRFNQLILSAPIWLILGLSGMFRSFDKSGWEQSEKNENYGKMY